MQKKKSRVYELARTFGKTDREVIEVLKKHNFDVTSRLSGVDDSAKEILEKEFSVKKKKRPPMRTVRFDQQGRPTDRKQQDGARKSSYSSISVPEEPKPAPKAETRPAAAPKTEVKPAPKVETRPAPAPKAEPKPAPKTETRPVSAPKTETRPAARQERNTRQDSRPADRTFRPARPQRDGSTSRQGDRPQRDRNDRFGNRQGDRPNRQGDRPARSGDRFGDRNGRPVRNTRPETSEHYEYPEELSERPRQERQARPHQDRKPQDRQNRGAQNDSMEETPVIPAQRREKPAKKKTKKDWERSRREKEGGSLMARSLNQNNKKKKHMADRKSAAYPIEVELPPSVTVKELAELFGREVSEIIKALMMDGVMATINQNLDRDTIEILAEEFGVTIKEAPQAADPTEYTPAKDDPRFLKTRPAVVTIMGHVDHGKTTLLDALRQTNVAQHEAGGITQRIGAYQLRYKGHKITFLDTPGHEAFTAMRSRGAQITDIAVLIVAADDGVMPQTVEAIHHAKNAGVPIMVAINKIDKPGANPDRIKEELSKEGLLCEEWGGDVIMTPISAKKKIGLDDLLENILLVAEVQELKANPNREAYGVVVEAQLDKGRGPVMSVLVQNGTLHVGDGILAGKSWGRVRAMTNENGRKLKNAEPSAPAEILGMDSVPEAGDHFYVMDERKAREIAELRAARAKEEEQKNVQKVTLDNIFEKIKEGEMKELDIIIKADVQGSVEALVQSLQGIKSDEVRISIVHSAVGAINESDVMLASASKALIIGFNVRPDANARAMAEKDGVDIRLYRVIYDCIDDVKAAMAGMLAPTIREVVLGHAEVRQVIHTPKVIVAGSYVQDGKVTSTCQLRLIRDGIVIHEGKIASLRRFKDDVKEVAAGFECGIAIDSYRDVKEGDQLESFELKEEAAKLE
ncbi:translation initiation factor IF-2 [Dialister sp.]|uniref:translation initiation factor IF-2 n=1 Tax=Dialister sp. TaxID=1955814 RepID=UPI002E821A12|nr:translation initiation factor IF-2 [Dialister sp.]MEE3452685.1 translation initiation factor IF-2 [Dialister sp.]